MHRIIERGKGKAKQGIAQRPPAMLVAQGDLTKITIYS
jgi:hypothetical protein